MCLYLTKRGATYYFRRAIPAELRPAFNGDSEFIFSLRTKDKEEAKRRRCDEAQRTTRLLDEARAASLAEHARSQTPAPPEPRGPTPYDIEQAEHEAEELAAKEARREEVSGLITFLEEKLKGSTRQLPYELRAFRYMLEGREFDTQLLRDQLLKARAENRELEARLRSSAVQTPSPAAGDARQGASPTAPAAVPLLATFDAYAAAQGIKSAVEWRARIADLVAFVGHDDAALLTVEDVKSWRQHLLSETVRGGEKRNARTVRSTYISALRATLNWAVEEGKLATNVAQSVVVRVPKQARLRQPDFTMDEAKSILRASLVADPKLSTERAFARRWIPWLCAYTGGRVNEFSQLRREDVREVDGIWVVVITPEAGTTKTNEARTVPIHAHLLEQGFVAAVRAKPEGPLFYDPSKQRVSGDGSRHYKKVGERLAEWVRAQVGITDPAVKPNHGWRHTFKTLAMTGEMSERIADYIQGHAPKTVARTYGSIPLAVLTDAINRLPRFDLAV